MRTLIRAALTTLLAAPFTPRLAVCSCLAMSFEWQLRRDKVIFAGTVLSYEPAGLVQGIPGTRYRFGQVRYAKGSGREDTLLVEQAGGLAASGYGVGDEVNFKAGVRYVVFAMPRSEGSPGPLHASGCEISPFEIKKDSACTAPVIRIYGGSVAGMDEGHIVVVRPDPRSALMSLPTIGPDRQFVEPAPLPKMGIRDLIRVADSLDAETLRRGNSISYPSTPKFRWIFVSSEQDPGVRVSEEEFLAVLTSLVKRFSGASADSAGGR